VGGAAADQSNAPTEPAERPPATPVPTHALSGVVKFVDSTRLVITRAGKNPGEMTFVLSPTTHREGPISVGATIQVRFRTEGHTRVATAILASPPKHPGTKVPEPLIHFSRATSPESADT
jgi:hypothetical protein